MRPPASASSLTPGHARQPVPERQLCNLDPLSSKLSVIGHHEGVCASRRDKYAFKICRITLDLDLELHAQIPCRSLGLSYILICVRTGFADQQRNSIERGNQLFDHLQSLRYDI